MSNENKKEFIQKAKSAEVLKAIAKANGELTEEELNAVSGGVTPADEQDETKDQESPLQFI